MSWLNMGVGAVGLAASVWIIAITIHKMGRRNHAAALWLMAVGIGLTSVASLFLPAGADLDTGMTLAGDALVVLGAWSIILTRSRDG